MHGLCVVIVRISTIRALMLELFRSWCKQIRLRHGIDYIGSTGMPFDIR